MWDAIVVGAGPAGSSAALALHGRGTRVLLLERSTIRQAHPGESLVGEGLVCLDELGLSEAFRALEARPCYLHHIRWSGKSFERPSILRSSGEPYQLDRVAFDEMLLGECGKRGIPVKRGAIVSSIAAETGAVRVEFRDEAGQRVSTESAHVIDATGRSAWVCRHLGARRERADKLVALAATFERLSTEPSSLIESAPNGWWYSAPRPGGLMTAMYVTELSSESARDVEEIWQPALTSAPFTAQRVRDRSRLSPVRAYRAGPEWTELDPSVNVLPVGDAALSFDPMAGDGLCFALRSGIEAARAIASTSLRRAYRKGTQQIYDTHLEEREAAYAAERALRPAPFWQCRRDVIAGALGSPSRSAHDSHFGMSKAQAS